MPEYYSSQEETDVETEKTVHESPKKKRKMPAWEIIQTFDSTNDAEKMTMTKLFLQQTVSLQKQLELLMQFLKTFLCKSLYKPKHDVTVKTKKTNFFYKSHLKWKLPPNSQSTSSILEASSSGGMSSTGLASSSTTCSPSSSSIPRPILIIRKILSA
ncbi:hypothetical protein BpHYR1_026441 [Brachionus plicatilis]|uniref:Uncharacterized protein n=1 Tax=Brachionus plicatilis TaxID=10195 RepID=A0A3M7S7X7_BRAPC|nr:hypothetical protein BpHYR1_026441 [Brachionus plicatilis]